MVVGTRLALQWILVKGFRLYSFQLPDSKSLVLLFIITTSSCQDWVICAPTAFLGCGSCFSGSFFGIEPWFFVTHQYHSRPLSYHWKLIGHKFEWCVANTMVVWSIELSWIIRAMGKSYVGLLCNKYIPYRSRGLWHVSALELLWLSE